MAAKTTPSYGLSERWLRHAAGDVAVDEAAAFLYEGMVSKLVATPTTARAVVLRSRPYPVALRLDGRGFSFKCTCGHAGHGALCRHAIAVALAWIHAGAAPPPGEPPRSKKLRHLGPWVGEPHELRVIRQRALDHLPRPDGPGVTAAPSAVHRTHPAYQFVGSFLDEGDAAGAWWAARTHGATLDQWAYLVRLWSREHPAECLPVYGLLIDGSVLQGDERGYMAALRWLREAYWVACLAGDPKWLDRAIQDLLARHKRRRKFIAMLTNPPQGPEADLAWRELFLAAKRFCVAAPWRYMQNLDIVGVLDSESGEIGWCGVLGNAGEYFGLALYRGEVGYGKFRRMMDEEGPEDEALFGQEALVLSFLDRDELPTEAHERVKRAGVQFRSLGTWPWLESHHPNQIPSEPTHAEVRRMTAAIDQVLDVATRVEAGQVDLDPDAQGRRLVRVPVSEGGVTRWVDERRSEPAPAAEPVPEFDRVRAARLRESLGASPLQLECDLFPAPVLVEEPGKPAFAPAMFMAVDASGGFVHHMAITDPGERHAWVQTEFMEALDSLQARPSVMYLARPSLEHVLAPVAEALGIRVERVDRLRMVEAARDSMAERVRTQGP